MLGGLGGGGGDLEKPGGKEKGMQGLIKLVCDTPFVLNAHLLNSFMLIEEL